MESATPRLSLPLLAIGQAQKELTHNEALALVDLALGAVADAIATDTPPDAPVEGQCWIVGDAPSGAWSGQAGALAGWTDGGWRFVRPHEGMAVWLKGEMQQARYRDGTWVRGDLRGERLLLAGQQVVGPRQPAIAAPVAGGTVDVEARACLDAVLSTLRSHGLIAA